MFATNQRWGPICSSTHELLVSYRPSYILYVTFPFQFIHSLLFLSSQLWNSCCNKLSVGGMRTPARDSQLHRKRVGPRCRLRSRSIIPRAYSSCRRWKKPARHFGPMSRKRIKWSIRANEINVQAVWTETANALISEWRLSLSFTIQASDSIQRKVDIKAKRNIIIHTIWLPFL